jgi:hypothetical protein
MCRRKHQSCQPPSRIRLNINMMKTIGVIRINNQNKAQLQSKKNRVRRCGLVFYVSLTA